QPGEEVDISIYQSNGVNMSSFHKSISTELKVDATVLEPIGGTNMGTVDVPTRMRIIPLTGIPVNTSPTSTATKTFKFRAMLGDSESVKLILQNSRTDSGKVNFDESQIGTFTLLNVCHSGGVRTYDPTPTAQLISIKPNPASSSVEIDYELSEQGNTKIWLANVLGNNVMQLLDEFSVAGVKSLNFNTSNLSNGVYFVIMQTPTQIFKSRISIIK
ncbi:MAG: T9SS type A sorting domain-containing protein, partial [FCB group bacterium]